MLHSDAELALDVLSDMITNSMITADDVDAERAVILDEISMHTDDPTEQAAEAVAAAIFGNSGLGRAVIGSRSSVATLTPAADRAALEAALSSRLAGRRRGRQS